MKLAGFSLVLAALAIVVLSVEAKSQRAPGVEERQPHKVIFRKATGELSDDSIYFAQQLEQKTVDEGRVVVWVTIDVSHKLHTSNMSEVEIDNQGAKVAAAFDKVLGPMVRQGKVGYANVRTRIVGQSSRVWATRAGLQELIEHEQVLHIVESQDSP